MIIIYVTVFILMVSQGYIFYLKRNDKVDRRTVINTVSEGVVHVNLTLYDDISGKIYLQRNGVDAVLLQEGNNTLTLNDGDFITIITEGISEGDLCASLTTAGKNLVSDNNTTEVFGGITILGNIWLTNVRKEEFSEWQE